ncbi:MAG: hypothetical protein ACYTGX_03755 [Planctomycetota bacterium]|jgi:hypothetical protein
MACQWAIRGVSNTTAARARRVAGVEQRQSQHRCRHARQQRIVHERPEARGGLGVAIRRDIGAGGEQVAVVPGAWQRGVQRSALRRGHQAARPLPQRRRLGRVGPVTGHVAVLGQEELRGVQHGGERRQRQMRCEQLGIGIIAAPQRLQCRDAVQAARVPRPAAAERLPQHAPRLRKPKRRSRAVARGVGRRPHRRQRIGQRLLIDRHVVPVILQHGHGGTGAPGQLEVELRQVGGQLRAPGVALGGGHALRSTPQRRRAGDARHDHAAHHRGDHHPPAPPRARLPRRGGAHGLPAQHPVQFVGKRRGRRGSVAGRLGQRRQNDGLQAGRERRGGPR